MSEKIMTIIGSDGSKEEVEVVLAFEFKETKEEFVVYTKNEKDENDMIKVYASRVDRSSGEPALMGIDDEETWASVNEVLCELAERDVPFEDGSEIMFSY